MFRNTVASRQLMIWSLSVICRYDSLLFTKLDGFVFILTLHFELVLFSRNLIHRLDLTVLFIQYVVVSMMSVSLPL